MKDQKELEKNILKKKLIEASDTGSGDISEDKNFDFMVNVLKSTSISNETTVINPPKNTILANRIKSGSRVISYKVKRGDTLSEIAELYGIRLSTLKSFNGISGNMIRINQTLQIPIYK